MSKDGYKKHLKQEAKVNGDLYRSKPIYPRKRLKFSLPLGISVNHMYFYYRGKRKLTAKARDYIREATALINASIEDQHWMNQREATWYYVDLVFYFKDRRIRDSHNLLKLLLDCIQNSGMVDNDYFIMPRIQSVEFDSENPRIDICIKPQTEKDRSKATKICKVGE